MRAMILAAGRGKRMGALTEHIPKPLLKIQDRYLIEYAIHSLTKINIQDIVINVSYHKEKIKNALGNGDRYGVTIHYSEEEEALETGGGIYHALPLLGTEPFIVISSDIITDYPLQQLPKNPESLAHLLLVDNPTYHPNGDFGLEKQRIVFSNTKTLTFASLGIYRPELFSDCKPGRFRLTEVLNPAIEKKQVTGEYYSGRWQNMGTPEDISG